MDLVPTNSLAALSEPELEAEARRCLGNACASAFRLGDILLEIQRRSGEKPQVRWASLRTFAERIGISPQQARALARVSAMFPPGEREGYPNLQWGGFRALTERTGQPGDTPVSRKERVRRLAKQASDQGGGTNTTRRLIERDLRPEMQSNECAALLTLFENSFAAELLAGRADTATLRAARVLARKARKHLEGLLGEYKINRIKRAGTAGPAV